MAEYIKLIESVVPLKYWLKEYVLNISGEGSGPLTDETGMIEWRRECLISIIESKTAVLIEACQKLELSKFIELSSNFKSSSINKLDIFISNLPEDVQMEFIRICRYISHVEDNLEYIQTHVEYCTIILAKISAHRGSSAYTESVIKNLVILEWDMLLSAIKNSLKIVGEFKIFEDNISTLYEMSESVNNKIQAGSTKQDILTINSLTNIDIDRAITELHELILEYIEFIDRVNSDFTETIRLLLLSPPSQLKNL